MADEIIDRTAITNLLDTVGGDVTFLSELAAAFFEDTPAQIKAARQALAGDRADDLRRAAHSLKSNCRNFGATDLAQKCKELEDTGKSGILSGADKQIDQIEAAYPAVKIALEECIRDLS